MDSVFLSSRCSWARGASAGLAADRFVATTGNDV